MPAPTTLSPLAHVFAGEEVEAQLLDGQILTVRVRALPARKHLDYLVVANLEAQALELCCTHAPGQPELPEGWVDALTDESHLLLSAKVKELNFTRATATLQRSAEVARMLESQAKTAGALKGS